MIYDILFAMNKITPHAQFIPEFLQPSKNAYRI